MDKSIASTIIAGVFASICAILAGALAYQTKRYEANAAAKAQSRIDARSELETMFREGNALREELRKEKQDIERERESMRQERDSFKAELEDTKRELRATKTELRATKRALEAARKQLEKAGLQLVHSQQAVSSTE